MLKAIVRFEVVADSEGQMRDELEKVFRREAGRMLDGGDDLYHSIRDQVGNPVGRVFQHLVTTTEPALKVERLENELACSQTREVAAREELRQAEAIFDKKRAAFDQACALALGWRDSDDPNSLEVLDRITRTLLDRILEPVKVTFNSDTWVRIYKQVFSDFHIADPDGWDRFDGGVSWAEEITQEEFESRCIRSSMMIDCQFNRHLVRRKESE